MVVVVIITSGVVFHQRVEMAEEKRKKSRAGGSFLRWKSKTPGYRVYRVPPVCQM